MQDVQILAKAKPDCVDTAALSYLGVLERNAARYLWTRLRPYTKTAEVQIRSAKSYRKAVKAWAPWQLAGTFLFFSHNGYVKGIHIYIAVSTYV